MGVKVYDGSSGQWVEFGGGGGSGASGTPGGNDKQVQFNDNGTLAGADGLEFEKDTNSPDLTLKPASTQTSGINGGDIKAHSTINAITSEPWNKASLSSDGALEIFRTRVSSPRGGPYIDFTSQEGADFDSRLQMDYDNGDVDNGTINPSGDKYSSLTFLTGGYGLYDPSTNPNGRTTEKIRIGKFGEIGISAGTQVYDSTQNPPVILNNRTDEQKYGSSGAVIMSNGKGSSVSWSKQPVASAYVNFDGTTNTGGNCTIRDGYNVSSVTDIGTGIYTINFTTSFPNVNYAVATSFSSLPFIANNSHGNLYTNTYSAGSLIVECFKHSSGSTKIDKNEIGVVIFTTQTTT